MMTDMSKPTRFADHLIALGWTDPAACSRGVTVIGGPKGGPALMLQPAKNRGPAIGLRAALPVGAKVTVGEESGTIEYSKTTHYVRIAAGQDFDSPTALLADMLAADATIEVAS